MAWLDFRVSGVYLRDRLPKDPYYSEPLGKISRKEAEKLLNKYEVKKSENEVSEGEFGRLMSEVYSQFILHLERENYSPKTIKQMRYDVLPLIKKVMRVKQLTDEKIKEHREALYSYRKENGKPYAIDSIAHRLRAIRAFCAWMETEEILTPSPFKVKIPEGRKDAGRALKGPEVIALFKSWPKSRIYNKRRSKHDISKLFFMIVFFGGTRLTEVLGDTGDPINYPGLQHEAVDRERQTINLAKTKSGDSREVALPKEIIAAIPQGVGPVFRGKIEENALREHLNEALKAAKIEGRVRIHDGRVTSATEWLRTNPDIKMAMDQFGWKSERMPVHYNKVATERRIEHAQKMTYQ